MESNKLQYKSARGARSTKTTHHLLLPHLQKIAQPQLSIQRKDPISLHQRQIQNSKLLLLKKGGLKAMATPNHNLRDATKDEDEQKTPTKKFQKNYASCSKMEKSQTKITETSIFQSRKQKGNNSQSKQITAELKDNKQYSKKLNKDSGKDNQKLAISNKTYRITKVETRSQKILTDAIIALNQQEGKLQKEILQLHKRSIKQMDTHKYNFTFGVDKASSYLNKNSNKELNGLEGNAYCEMLVSKLSETLKMKKKEFAKIENHIEHNEYIKYLLNVRDGIEEMNSSEEDDTVGELMPSQITEPKAVVDPGSYSAAMQIIKNKRYALNQRRTYEVFRPGQNSFSNNEKQPINQQTQSQSGQNKITINNHFKDFLLS